jgi:hypothetical protein
LGDCRQPLGGEIVASKQFRLFGQVEQRKPHRSSRQFADQGRQSIHQHDLVRCADLVADVQQDRDAVMGRGGGCRRTNRDVLRNSGDRIGSEKRSILRSVELSCASIGNSCLQVRPPSSNSKNFTS